MTVILRRYFHMHIVFLDKCLDNTAGAWTTQQEQMFHRRGGNKFTGAKQE